jgi:tRNA (cmo5U34)-methyltransferase
MQTKNWVSHFDSTRADTYDTNIPRFIPGYELFSNLSLDIIAESYYTKNPNPKILVVGAGTGNESLMIASKFSQAEVLAIDPSPQMLDKLNQKIKSRAIKNIKTQNCFLHELDLSQSGTRFDFVVSFLVMHFIPDSSDSKNSKKQFLQDVFNCLKLSARLILVDKCFDEFAHDEIFSFWRSFQINAGKTPQEADDNLALIKSELPYISGTRLGELGAQIGFSKCYKFFKAFHVEGFVLEK